MMTEISLNVLDITENSVKAGATLINITVNADTAKDRLTITIDDNGCGMTPEQLSKVTDPFFTTRTTRKVGLGVPFLREAAEAAEGTFTIESEPGVGTKDTATFRYSSIDRMPLGDISATIQQLIVYHPETDFLYTYSYDGASFVLDTREMKEILGGVSLAEPEVAAYILEYLEENKRECDGGAVE